MQYNLDYAYTMIPAQRYIFAKMHTVRGYMDPADALLFVTLFEAQASQGWSGGAAEIGVYYGRSYYLMRHLLRQDEKAFASDLFDMGETKAGESEQLRSFLENGQKLGFPVDRDYVAAGDSANLSSDLITNKVGNVRFFHVDGGHEFDHIETDSSLAKASLSENGIICFDDFFNPGWPDVTTGVIDFLRDNSNYAPFALSNKKAYVCHRVHSEFYRGIVQSSPYLRRFSILEKIFIDDPILFINHLMPKRVSYEILIRLGLSRLSSWLY